MLARDKNAPAKPAMKIFAVTIFTSAFLLFQVQPLIAKFVLPWFGGSPAVWTTCMLFFQFFLLAGYAYAHGLTRFFAPRKQAGIHVALLLLTLVTLPIVPGENWKPQPGQSPTGQILLLLAVCLGLPYFALSATGPLLQAWFSRLRPGVVPYRLYALSNVGSLLALLSYPFLVEPMLTRRTQASLWSWVFVGFTLLCAGCAGRLWRHRNEELPPADSPAAVADTQQPPDALTRLWWFALPACGSVLLLATTNKLCQDVAVVPFLWVLPLSLYLLTFIIAFDRPRWYARRFFLTLLVLALAAFCYFQPHESEYALTSQIALYGALLFVACLVCHGELYRLRPPARLLTSFYLLLSAGGMAGGVFVVVMAPLMFDSYAELTWGLCGLPVLLAGVLWLEAGRAQVTGPAPRLWAASLAGAVVLAVVLFVQSRDALRSVIFVARDFYGIQRVTEVAKDTPYYAHNLRHGNINHGLQFRAPELASLPTVYYNEPSGIGLAFAHLPRQTNRHIGLIGLGAGTLATYGRPGDVFRFYEINPNTKLIAETQYTFLSNCTARVEVVLGDGRLSLENATPQAFDLLVLDAFSGDAVPVHLLTREAFAIYLRHVKPDGVIALHVSNRNLDLVPVALGAAAEFQLGTAYIFWQKGAASLFTDPSSNSGEWWLESSRWVLLSRNEAFLQSEAITNAATPIYPNAQPVVRWTDDHASLFNILR